MLKTKFKCPVCSEECITLKDKFQIVNKGHINCSNCNAKLEFAPKSDSKSYLPLLAFLIVILYFALNEYKDQILFIAVAIMLVYPIFFHELKECPPKKPQEPKFNINEFLDNLRKAK